MDTSKVKQMLSTEDIICLVTEGLGSMVTFGMLQEHQFFRLFVTTHLGMVVINFTTIPILKCFIVTLNVVQWMCLSWCSGQRVLTRL